LEAILTGPKIARAPRGQRRTNDTITTSSDRFWRAKRTFANQANTFVVAQIEYLDAESMAMRRETA
jgi:hypothetical protein